MIKKLIYVLILISFIFNFNLHAQQGKVDNTFNTLDDGLNGDGFNDPVRTLMMQSDGNLIVGGEFLSLNGIPLPYLTRLQSDGTVDETFHTGTGFNGKIYASYIQPDGKIIVGGSFTSYNGNTCGRLIRLNADGSNDPTFNTSIGATTGIVYNIDQQSDGKIIIVGSFTRYNNVTVNRIARLLPNGALDSSFITGAGSTVNITNVKVLPNAKILISGNFVKFNVTLINKLARLNSDGTVDTSFDVGAGFNDDVNAMAVQPDGKIILGGTFTTYNGIIANRIIRINENGSPDTTFISGSGIDKGAVQVIKTDGAGNIMAGGSFTGFYNGVDINRVFFLNENGAIKTDFDLGSGPGSGSIWALENDADGSWYIGGSFSVFDGQNQGRLAKVNADGEHDISYLSAGIGFDNSVLKILSLENNKTMVFGNFSKFNNGFAPKIIRLLENGSSDDTFNEGKSGANKVIRTAVSQKEDGKIIFGGDFSKYNDITCNRIARIFPDGAIDNSFNTGTGCNAAVYTLAIDPDNKVIVAGNFTSYNGISGVGRIVRLLSDGSRDTSFNVGLGANGIIESVLIQPDRKILVAGRFTTFNGSEFAHIVRLNSDGSIDSSFRIGNGFDKNIYTIALQSDNKIIVGGNFAVFNETSQKRILRLNSNGTLDTTFESGTGFSNGDVRSILVQPDDRILVGGTFSGTYKGNTSLRLIRLQKTGSYDPSFEAPLNNKLFSMSFTANYRVLIGGNFNSVSGISKHRIARLKLCLGSTSWNGINWSNGLPSGGKEVFFKENFTSLTTSNVCSCSIDEGKIVTLSEGNTLGIEFSYLGSGTLVLEEGASLYQSDDDMINTGTIHFKRKTKPVLRYDYTYWSSPVENQKLIAVFPTTLIDKYHSYDHLLQSWHYEETSNTMVVGKGYSIRAPQEFSITERAIFEAVFKGIPNNGKIQADLGKENSFNLIGNPYPSAIDANTFLTQNTLKIKGALYFWTHNTPVTNLKYNLDDYATYNLVGGVATSTNTTGINSTEPDGTIAAGQSFFLQSKDLGTAEFTDAMRIAGRNSSFFKPAKTEKITNETNVDKHRIWLNFQNDEGLFKQILVGYLKAASNSFDENYDAVALNGNQFVEFYSSVENKKLVIQGRALPFVETDAIVLGYKTTIEGNYNINLDHQDGLFNGLNIFIEDKDLNIIHNLKESAYQFNSKTGSFSDRFILRFTNEVLGINDFQKEENTVFVSVKDRVIKITSNKETLNDVAVFDVSGKMLYIKKKIDLTEWQITNLKAVNQVLLVKITLENKNHISRKIIF